MHTLGEIGESCNRGSKSFAVFARSDRVLLRNRNAIGVVAIEGHLASEKTRVQRGRGRNGGYDGLLMGFRSLIKALL